LLVHICCSVDSHYFLQKLRDEYPNKKLAGFFYNPNIHPFSEYSLRLNDVKRSCELLGIELHQGEYNIKNWLLAIKGLENEPEKGERCSVCFDYRFEESAKKAKELEYNSFTSTLLMSPKKSLEQLSQAGNSSADKYNIDFISIDYRKEGGTNEQSLLAKKDKLFKQDYCGCVFALVKQREGQKKLAYELMSPIHKQIQPSSTEEKLELYAKRVELEKENIDYFITKEGILNYRLLNAKVVIKSKTISSYILAYSLLKRGKTQGKIEFIHNKIGFFNRENIRIMDIKTFNILTNSRYENVDSLNKSPLVFEEEIFLRGRITKNNFSSSPIIILDKIVDEKYKIFINSSIFNDTRESLIIKGK
jgi:predicted adenine nucleotide alpha hydrolase (AANH) superfamily ATPase